MIVINQNGENVSARFLDLCFLLSNHFYKISFILEMGPYFFSNYYNIGPTTKISCHIGPKKEHPP